MNGALLRETASWAFWRLVAAAALVAATAAVASAGSCWDQCDECDLHNCNLSCCYDPPELWVINTRCVPKCSNLDQGFECISYQRYDACRHCFVKECRESFLAQEASMPTLFFVHGNTLKHPQAMEQCWEVYHRMRCCPGPKRLVFWSWPAQIAFKRPILRPKQLILKNLRIKFVYSEYQGYYMAKLIQQMSFAQRITIGGHSYGAIHAAVAAHFLGGGCLRGLVLDGGMPVQRDNFRIAMISAAFDCGSIYPGCRYGNAFTACEKVFNTRNPIDKTLKNWPKVSLCGAKALGVTGINPFRLGEYQPKLCQMTTTGDVGKSHYIKPYLGSDRFVAALCCISFPKCCTMVAERQGFKSTALVKNDSPKAGAKPQAATASTEAPKTEETPAAISVDTEVKLAPAANAAEASPAPATNSEAATPAGNDGDLSTSTDGPADSHASLVAPLMNQDVWTDWIGEFLVGLRKAA